MRFIIALGLVALTAAPSAAAILGLGTPGQTTVLEDQNREAVFDVDGDQRLSVGDVIVGYSRLDDRTLPLGLTLAPTDELLVFAIEAKSITRVNGMPRAPGQDALISFGPVTGLGAALGLDIAGITGGQVTQAGAVAANFSNVATDKIIIGSGPVGPGYSILDLISEISTEGSLSTVAGFGDSTDFWLSAFLGASVASPVDNLPGLAAVGLATPFGNPLFGGNFFFAGLSVLSADSAQYADVISQLGSPVPGSTHQMAIINGEISGAGNANFGGGENPFFGSITNTLLGVTVNYYGAASNADVTFQLVPEPVSAMLVLTAGFLLGARRMR